MNFGVGAGWSRRIWAGGRGGRCPVDGVSGAEDPWNSGMPVTPGIAVVGCGSDACWASLIDTKVSGFPLFEALVHDVINTFGASSPYLDLVPSSPHTALTYTNSTSVHDGAWGERPAQDA